MEPLPPERFDLGDALLRWTVPADVPAMVAGARASFAELTPWMVWAPTLDALNQESMADFVDRATAERSAGGSTVAYSLWEQDAGAFLGGIGLHERIGPGGIEIGYWLVTSATGRGLVSRSAALLTDAALATPGVDRVEIHCDEANDASAAVPRRLGFDLVDVVDDAEFAIRSRRLMIWRRTAPAST